VLAFLQRYYLHTAPEDLADRDPVDVFGAAFSHYRLAGNRPQGTANVRVHTPTVEENGWTCSHSVVEVVTDDMPFLVDSVTNELTRRGRGIHVVVHPQFVVRRDLTGKLLEVLPTGPSGQSLPHDAHIESWIHVEIDRETDRGDLKEITADLLRVLSDVREAVEDWEKMRGAAIRIADGLPAETLPADLPGQQVEEARELLRWLADDHFTSSATASTNWVTTTRWPPCPAPVWAYCEPTRSTPATTPTRSARPSSGCPPTRAPRRASTSCWC
jgi:glutamate dehydrogenase